MRFGALAAVFLAAMMVGCQHKAPQGMAPTAPASEDVVHSIRESMTRVDPHARVGVVTGIYENLAAVSDIPVKDFSEGDALTFIDTNQEVLTHGSVVKITADSLHIRFDPPAADRRAPQVGDLAVRVK